MASLSASDDGNVTRRSREGQLNAVRFSRPMLSAHSGQGSSRSSVNSGMTPGKDKHDVMVRYLFRKCTEQGWFELFDNSSEGVSTDQRANDRGVILRRPDGECTAEPMFLHSEVVGAVDYLKVPVAITMSSDITQSLFEQISPLQTEFALDPRGLAIPIIHSIRDIAMGVTPVTKDKYMCLCREERFLFLWSDTVQSIISHGNEVEARLLGAIWGSFMPVPSARNSRAPDFSWTPNRHSAQTTPHSQSIIFNQGPVDAETSEKIGVVANAIQWEENGDKLYDPEKDGQGPPPPRPFLLTHGIVIALSVILVVVVEMACVAKLLQEVRLDGSYMRFVLVVTLPLFASFSLFFMIVIMGSLFQLFGPLSNCQKNSIYYSAVAPKLGRYPDLELPHITIQMPVYKEGLKGVIMPTVSSVLAAVRSYEEHGGTASIYVNDDGMQLVSEELATARKTYYELNNIGWCSRPKHCPESENEEDVIFVRKGQFKKASNMNYCLDFSLRVEDELQRLIDLTCGERHCTQEDLTIEEENKLYEEARNRMVEQDGGRTWAAGNVRIGEIILIIDSDTRVPEDCLVYGALEMHESPEVALLQHSSGIMQVAHNVFENGITYFTNLIYTSIQFAVGNGDVAPFVGHNTFIRWRALQSISFEEDDKTKFWSENHVSEDFDVSLRFQMQGFIIRLATYHNGGFQEGVSLTVYDELARWEKYAYGCNELVFNPLMYWPIRGPLTRLFWRFLFSKVKITSKITILAYIGTYYAIASAIPLTLANYLIIGWLNDNVDQYYIASWKIFVGMAVIFNLLSPLAYAMLRHRLGQQTFFVSIIESIKWTPMFLLFFGGLSYHLLKAIICHFLCIRMEWTTTAKELESSGFRIGLDRIVRDFKWMYLFILPVAGGMIYLALYAPRGWVIDDFTAIVPLANQVGCHALLPFALGLF